MSRDIVKSTTAGRGLHILWMDWLSNLFSYGRGMAAPGPFLDKAPSYAYASGSVRLRSLHARIRT